MEVVSPNGPHRRDGLIVPMMEHLKSNRGAVLWAAGESGEGKKGKKGENMRGECNYRHQSEVEKRKGLMLRGGWCNFNFLWRPTSSFSADSLFMLFFSWGKLTFSIKFSRESRLFSCQSALTDMHMETYNSTAKRATWARWRWVQQCMIASRQATMHLLSYILINSHQQIWKWTACTHTFQHTFT